MAKQFTFIAVPHDTAPINLPSDLKNYRAPVDAFQILEEGAAGIAFCVMLVIFAVVVR